MLAQQEKWCKIGIIRDFRADVAGLQKQQKLESLAETFDLQRPELLHAANTCVHPDVTSKNTILPPWEQLLKAHYRSSTHRPGIGYNHFRRGIPTGREWLCVGKNRPPKSYNQGQKTLKRLLSSSTQKWNPDADWKDNVVRGLLKEYQ
jgi:hypothetical protein